MLLSCVCSCFTFTLTTVCNTQFFNLNEYNATKRIARCSFVTATLVGYIGTPLHLKCFYHSRTSYVFIVFKEGVTGETLLFSMLACPGVLWCSQGSPGWDRKAPVPEEEGRGEGPAGFASCKSFPYIDCFEGDFCVGFGSVDVFQPHKYLKSWCNNIETKGVKYQCLASGCKGG